jgi:hypothetical protein
MLGIENKCIKWTNLKEMDLLEAPDIYRRIILTFILKQYDWSVCGLNQFV